MLYDCNLREQCSNREEFAEGSKANAGRDQQDRLKILKVLWIQKQMKEEDFALSHIQTRSK
uniref:Uncharacterized protein n=1 Tax=Capra hircus TaxID=9925 RepID=A0A8C2P634_CAPHI